MTLWFVLPLDIVLWAAIFLMRRPARIVDVWDRIDRNIAMIEANLAVVALNGLAVVVWVIIR